MSRATDAFDRLARAMETTDPACQNDDRFILDDQPVESLAHICRACPLTELCAEYAQLERPKAGIRAGTTYRKGTR